MVVSRRSICGDLENGSVLVYLHSSTYAAICVALHPTSPNTAASGAATFFDSTAVLSFCAISRGMAGHVASVNNENLVGP